MGLPTLFAPALVRRIARATRHRPTARTVTTTPVLLAKRNLRPVVTDVPTPTALSALLARLSLPSSSTLHPDLLACLTHPSYTSRPAEAEDQLGEPSESSRSSETNEVLASLGNSLLGLFASEHLATQFPYLPTSALKEAVTAYVGTKACLSVARELGLGTQNRIDENFNGVTVRWRRSAREGETEVETTPVARRFEPFTGGEKGHRRHEKKGNFEDVVAAAVKAFVGLIYREQGIHAARDFAHGHFLSRHLDMTTLFKFKNPKHVLSSVVASHLSQAGVEHSEGVGKIESRVLASTGALSQAPVFNIGLFLPSGLKLAEGFGSSHKMAEHRAASNALLSMFLVRSDHTLTSTSTALPSSTHASWPLRDNAFSASGPETYTPSVGVAHDPIVESSTRR